MTRARHFGSRTHHASMRLVAAVAAICCLAVVAVACSNTSVPAASPSSTEAVPSTLPAPSGTSGNAALPGLHHVGPWLVDGQGRVVITHGVNIVWKPAPYAPPAFSDQDAKFLVSEGFTAARISPLWAGLEPQPGHYDQQYLAQLVALNATLANRGIKALVELHQDFFSGKYPSGDGAPAWAALDDCGGATRCKAGPLQAFDNFWKNTPVAGTGLVAHFAGAWKAVAGAFKGADNLLGYDILNEPSAGASTGCALFSPCPTFEQDTLAAFYRKLIGTIRKVDKRHLIFYEPVPQLKGDATALPAPLNDDPLLGFSFHYYDRSCDLAADPTTPAAQRAQDARCTPAESSGLDAGIEYARRADAAVDLGEFGGSANYTDDANMVDLAGQRFLNWTYWMYYGGDAEPGGGTGGGGALLLHASQPGSEANATQHLLDALVVPYPEAVAGEPSSYSLDRSTWTMHFTYSTEAVDPAATCPSNLTEVFVPERHYPHGYTAKVTGGHVVSPAGWPWVEIEADPGAAQVALTLTPATDGTTGVPTAAVDPNAPVPACAGGAPGRQ